jgi:uncharacterized protein YdhG (YjbR/CyaY superfamily)
VDEYIAHAPAKVQPSLRKIRDAIRGAAPKAVERISYGMPHYSFADDSGVESRLCYFGFLKRGTRIVFYTRPGFLEGLASEVKPYLTTKSALQFPAEGALPVALVRRVVQNALRIHSSPGN